MDILVNSIKDYLLPPSVPAQPAEPAQKQARSDLSLEDLGLSLDVLKATAKLTPVLNEEVQNLSEESIRKSNPHFDFSENSIKKVKAARVRLPDQIEAYKNQVAMWESQLKDYHALMPAIKHMSMLRSKGRERQSLTRLSYTPSPPPAQSPLNPAVSIPKKRRLEFRPASDYDENEAPEQLLNFDDSDIYIYNNSSYDNSLKSNSYNTLSNDHSISNNSNHAYNHTYDNSLKSNNSHVNNHSNNHVHTQHSISSNSQSQDNNNNNNNNLNRGSPSPLIYPLIGDSRGY